MSEKLSLRREQTGDRGLNELQRLALELGQRANECPFFTGRRVTVTFAAGVDQVVNHGLGHRPQGVLILRDYGANVCTGVGESASSAQPPDLTKQIALRSPTASTVDLWIF